MKTIEARNLEREAHKIMTQLLPAKEFGESYEAERLENIQTEFKEGIAKLNKEIDSLKRKLYRKTKKKK